MHSLKPVRWQEGMFLRPQHLQQYDRFLESREACRLQAVERPAWGLLDLRLDMASLANEQFRVEELRAVLPDGTLIDVPGNALLAQRSFADHETEPGRPLPVAIGVRVPEPGTPHVGAGGGGRPQRYVPVIEEAHDLDVGGEPVELEHLAYDLRLFFGDEPTVGYETLPVARLVRTGDPGRPVILDPDFSAPSMALSAGESLRRHAREVVEMLTHAVRELGQHRSRTDPDPLILYSALSGGVPVLRDMVHDGQVHPRTAYHELARLAGALFYRDKTGRTAEEIPLYDHVEPGPVFRQLRDLIKELSVLVTKERYLVRDFTRSEDIFSVTFPDPVKDSGVTCYVQVVARESRDRVPLLLQAAKISAPGRLSFLREYAMPGVRADQMPVAPPELPPKMAEHPLFRLRMDEPEWREHVQRSPELAAFLLGAPQDVALKLVAVLPAG